MVLRLDKIIQPHESVMYNIMFWYSLLYTFWINNNCQALILRLYSESNYSSKLQERVGRFKRVWHTRRPHSQYSIASCSKFEIGKGTTEIWVSSAVIGWNEPVSKKNKTGCCWTTKTMTTDRIKNKKIYCWNKQVCAQWWILKK